MSNAEVLFVSLQKQHTLCIPALLCYKKEGTGQSSTKDNKLTGQVKWEEMQMFVKQLSLLIKGWFASLFLPRNDIRYK